jgi:hypothetical protein
VHPRIAVPLASAGPLAGVIGVIGFLAVAAWIAWRFGPTLARITGWCSWWVAWASGSQGGYGYCAAFLVLGALAWGAGTVWFAQRRGRWPSALSARLFARLLGGRNPVTQVDLRPSRPLAVTDAALSSSSAPLSPHPCNDYQPPASVPTTSPPG